MWPKKYVETYSSSSAAAYDPEERVFYNSLHTLIISKHNPKKKVGEHYVWPTDKNLNLPPKPPLNSP